MLIINLIQLVNELESIRLFLWPLGHSCAKSINLVRDADLFRDSTSKQPIDLDAVQTNLFDATPEDSFTVAQASSMGINYDDIGRCFEYPVEYNQTTGKSTYNMGSLETCKHGLRFDVPLERSLSVVGQFQLACSRQWLQLLLPQSMAFGLMLGLLLGRWLILRKSVQCNINEDNRGSSITTVLDTTLTQANARVSRSSEQTGSLGVSGIFWPWVSIQISACLLINYLGFYQLSAPHEMTSKNTNIGGEQVELYRLLLLSVFARSLVNSSSLVRILYAWQTSTQQQQISNHLNVGIYAVKQLTENHIYFVTLASLIVTFHAAYFPIALRVYANWSILNKCLGIGSSLLVGAVIMSELLMVLQLKSCHRYVLSIISAFGQRTNVASEWASRGDNGDETISLDSTTADEIVSQPQEELVRMANKRGRSTMATIQNSSNDEANTSVTNSRVTVGNHLLDMGSSSSTEVTFSRQSQPTRVCEFCLVNNEPSNSSVMMNHSRSYIHRSANNNHTSNSSKHNSHSTGHGDDSSSSSVVDLDAYQPTTIPIGCLDGGASMSLASRLSAQRDKRQPDYHNLGPAYRNLLRWPVLAQLWLLSACVSFNYFLFCSIPNHRLIHSESIASMRARKQTNHKHELYEFRLSNEVVNRSSVNLETKPIEQLNVSHYSIEVDADNNHHQPESNVSSALVESGSQPLLDTKVKHAFLIVNRTKISTNALNSSSTNLKPVKQQEFDYRSLNYATRAIDSMRYSNNPIEILWITTVLNAWPVELLVLFLHAGPLSTQIQSTYFKLNRLLVLVNFGAKLLLVEWLVIGEYIDDDLQLSKSSQLTRN